MELNTTPGALIKSTRHRPPSPPLVLFATPRVVLEEEPEGREAKQEGLEEPQAACGHVGDAFVAAGKYRRNTQKIRFRMTKTTWCDSSGG